MSKKAFVDQDLCIGCGVCVGNLPKVFRMNDDNRAECYDSTAATEDEIQSEAIDACPVSCICWE